MWSRCLPIGDKLPRVIGPRWLHRLRRHHYRDSLGLWNTFPTPSLSSSLSSCWNSSNEGLSQAIEKIEMKAVWALLLLFLSQADTYVGRRGPHRGHALGLEKIVSRQEPSSTYSWPWLLGRQSPSRRRPSTLESLGFKLRELLGFNPRGVKSTKRTLRLPRLRLPSISPLRLTILGICHYWYELYFRINPNAIFVYIPTMLGEKSDKEIFLFCSEVLGAGLLFLSTDRTISNTYSDIG